jgi:hypothetical protein
MRESQARGRDKDGTRQQRPGTGPMRGRREAAAAWPGDGARRWHRRLDGDSGPVRGRCGDGARRRWPDGDDTRQREEAAARRRRRLDGGAGGCRWLRRRLGKCHGDALPTPPLHHRCDRSIDHRPSGGRDPVAYASPSPVGCCLDVLFLSHTKKDEDRRGRACVAAAPSRDRERRSPSSIGLSPCLHAPYGRPSCKSNLPSNLLSDPCFNSLIRVIISCKFLYFSSILH